MFWFFSGLSWNTSILFLFWMNSQVGCPVFPRFLNDIQWLVLAFVCFFDYWEFWFLGLLQFLLLLGFLITPTEVCFWHFLSQPCLFPEKILLCMMRDRNWVDSHSSVFLLSFSFQVLRQLPTCYRYVQLVIPLFIRTYFSTTKQNKEKNDNIFLFTCLNEIIPLEMNMAVGCIWFFHATRNFLL